MRKKIKNSQHKKKLIQGLGRRCVKGQQKCQNPKTLKHSNLHLFIQNFQLMYVLDLKNSHN